MQSYATPIVARWAADRSDAKTGKFFLALHSLYESLREPPSPIPAPARTSYLLRLTCTSITLDRSTYASAATFPARGRSSDRGRGDNSRGVKSVQFGARTVEVARRFGDGPTPDRTAKYTCSVSNQRPIAESGVRARAAGRGLPGAAPQPHSAARPGRSVIIRDSELNPRRASTGRRDTGGLWLCYVDDFRDRRLTVLPEAQNDRFTL
ncbi:hypothetical protein EVAR_85244_1 [Eumeta japonica]|uniref:Uncharacterized protein n=1 Tax=Eumeta variegata TaxID=151549 RepID=A0A4C1VZR0_EUMVA|nr:hypothetical protein EVAR_85244_1 [Eumeta japonica]